MENTRSLMEPTILLSFEPNLFPLEWFDARGVPRNGSPLENICSIMVATAKSRFLKRQKSMVDDLIPLNDLRVHKMKTISD